MTEWEASLERELNPPVQPTEPLAALIERSKEIIAAANDYNVNTGDLLSQAFAALEKWIAAHPPTSEWNDAIEAAEEVVARMVQGVDMAPTVRAVRRLKRKPR